MYKTFSNTTEKQQKQYKDFETIWLITEKVIETCFFDLLLCIYIVVLNCLRFDLVSSVFFQWFSLDFFHFICFVNRFYISFLFD